MNDNYDDIKHLTRPQYDDFSPMSMSDRAAQFSSFSALNGYDEMIDEEAGWSMRRRSCRMRIWRYWIKITDRRCTQHLEN